MHVFDIVASMGVAMRGFDEAGWPKEWASRRRSDWRAPRQGLLGASQSDHVVLVNAKGTALICYRNDLPLHTIVADIIHELAHALVGPPGLDDEGDSGLLAVQWALMHELGERDLKACRKDFAGYNLPRQEKGQLTYLIGGGKSFLKSSTWQEVAKAAVDAGLLMPDGRLIWGLGSRFPG